MRSMLSLEGEHYSLEEPYGLYLALNFDFIVLKQNTVNC